MAGRQRRSLSLDSKQRCLHVDVPYSFHENNEAGAHCTCPRPSNYSPPHGRAIVQRSRALRHYPFISRSRTPPSVTDEYPLYQTDGSYTCRSFRPQFYPESSYPHYGRYAEGEQKCQSGYFANSERAQTLHLGYARTPENAIRHVYHLRAFPVQYAQLFVAEYDYLVRLRRYSPMEAEWTLPSFQPYYSVVYFKNVLANPVCCDSFRNICVATVGGGGPCNLCSNGTLSTNCVDSHEMLDRKDCHRPYKHFEQPQKYGSTRVSSAPGSENCSEPLTLENDVYDTGSAENSLSTRFACRQPYIPEESTSYRSSVYRPPKCRSSSTHSINSGGARPLVVRWVTTADKCSLHHARSAANSSDMNLSGNWDTSTIEREKEAINEINKLEGFLRLKNAEIEENAVSAQVERPICSPCHKFSNVSTANPICQCPVCVRTKTLGGPESSYTSPCAPSGMDRYDSCTSRSPIMVSVPSITGSTAYDMHDRDSRRMFEYTSAAARPKETSVSGPREDSRSGGRDTRRPTIRALCDEVQGGLCSDSFQSVATAHPIFDPNCNQCAEARFADRLCETLQKGCSCTPVIRIDPQGSLSLLNTSALKENDLVMDKQRKKSLLTYVTRATKRRAATVRDAVMYWVRTKAARKCKTRSKK